MHGLNSNFETTYEPNATVQDCILSTPSDCSKNYYIMKPADAPQAESRALLTVTRYLTATFLRLQPIQSPYIYTSFLWADEVHNFTKDAWKKDIKNTDLQAGRSAIKLEMGKTVSRQITFPRPFSAVPAVTVNAETTVLDIRMHATNITSSGFMAYASSDINADMSFDWIAVLP